LNPPGAAIIHNQSGHLFCTGGVMLCVSHGSRFLRQGRTTTESGRNTLLRTRTGDPFLAAARQSDKQLWLKDDDPVTSPHFFINLGRPVQGFSSSKRHTCAPRFYQSGSASAGLLFFEAAHLCSSISVATQPALHALFCPKKLRPIHHFISNAWRPA